MVFSLLDSMYLLMPELFKIPAAVPNEMLDSEMKQFIVNGLLEGGRAQT
jgi:hypothetical protein